MADNAIEVRELTRRFPNQLALDQVSLQVPRGVVFGLVGENGAGKTTLIKHLLGLFTPQHGEVRVLGHDPVADPPAVLSRVGYLSERRDLPEWMRVGQVMNYSRAFYPHWDDEFAEQLRRSFDLDAGRPIRALSRGQLARIGLLVALAHRPELLVLDEPSSGLDPVARHDILAAIVRTVADEGRTVLFSSHLLDEVQRVADVVAMIHQGQVVLHDSLDNILDAHHRIIVRYPQPLAEPPRLPGVLSTAGRRREWTCICNGGLEQLKQAATTQGAAIVEQARPSLEEIFVARARGGDTTASSAADKEAAK